MSEPRNGLGRWIRAVRRRTVPHVIALALCVTCAAMPGVSQSPATVKPPITCRSSTDRPLPAPPPPALPSTADEDRALAEAKPAVHFLAPQRGSEPPNIAFLRTQLQHYADCDTTGPCYWSDLQAQTAQASAALHRLLAEHHATTPALAREQRLAIVLDIDDTSLTTYCEQKREDYGFIPGLFNAWISSPDASVPIPGTLQFFKQARDAGVTVFFITGRDEELRSATEQNLVRAGFSGWQELILRSPAERPLTARDYKSHRRALLKAEGHWVLLLSMGDQWSDLLGEPEAEVSVKLSNPFYFLP